MNSQNDVRVVREADGRVAVRRGALELVIEASEEGGDWISVLVFVREVRAGLILVTPESVEVVQAGALVGDVIEWEV